MKTRNNRRKLARETCIVLALFIASVGGTLLFNANEQAEGFITVAHYWQVGFVNHENSLIKRVHEEHWDIFYQFHADCPDSRKTEENYRLLREKLKWGIRTWLAPLREITDRPIVDKFVFHQSKVEGRRYEISVIFECEKGRSSAGRSSRSIEMRESTVNRSLTPSLPYSAFVFLHEIGHAFDLADTYVGNKGFSPPSTGGASDTIGSQPHSVMSSDGCEVNDEFVLCLDDKRAIQWLYRYHYEGLDPTNCPPEFVYEELTHEGRTVGGCVYKQPLLTEIRQGHGEGVRRLLKNNKEIKINDKDEHGYTALHSVAPLSFEFERLAIGRMIRAIMRYPNIDPNITDKYGNSPLHWAAWFGNSRMVDGMLFITGAHEELENKATKLNAQNKYGETALHYAGKLGRDLCAEWLLRRTDINPNIKESRWGNTPLHEAAKNGHTEVVKMLLAHQDINPNLRNDAGFTPLQLAMQGGAVAAADSDTSFQAQHPELWASLPEEHRQQVLESSRLSPAALQQAHAEIAALLRAHPGIILPDASDVNGDGVVNILDLVKVSNAFGQRGPVPEDVNGDGVVNIQDLVWVSGAFGQE